MPEKNGEIVLNVIVNENNDEFSTSNQQQKQMISKSLLKLFNSYLNSKFNKIIVWILKAIRWYVMTLNINFIFWKIILLFEKIEKIRKVSINVSILFD